MVIITIRCHGAHFSPVDVHMDGLLGALRLEEEQLGNHDAAHVIIDRAHQADDAVLQQPKLLLIIP